MTPPASLAAGRGMMSARPSASECAQIIPSRRDTRQVQRFSTFDAERMRSPDFSSLSPSRTHPCKSGGS